MTTASRWMGGLITALALVGAGTGCATAAEGGGNLAPARAAVEAGRYDEAIPQLRAGVAAGGGTAQDAEARYLLGLSLFKQTDAELTRLRGEKAQRIDFLTEAQAVQLRESLEHLTKAVELAPQAPFAPDAAYLAARVQDWGYLKRYEAARKAYGGVIERYPGTEAARKAAERAAYWDNLFKHGEMKPGAPMRMH